MSGIESILLKYCDEILKPPLRLPTYIMEARVKILETYPKSEEIISFSPHIFVHLLVVLRLDGKSINRLFKTFDVV